MRYCKLKVLLHGNSVETKGSLRELSNLKREIEASLSNPEHKNRAMMELDENNSFMRNAVVGLRLTQEPDLEDVLKDNMKTQSSVLAKVEKGMEQMGSDDSDAEWRQSLKDDEYDA